jgi:hypothetical protein
MNNGLLPQLLPHLLFAVFISLTFRHLCPPCCPLSNVFTRHSYCDQFHFPLAILPITGPAGDTLVTAVSDFMCSRGLTGSLAPTRRGYSVLKLLCATTTSKGFQIACGGSLSGLCCLSQFFELVTLSIFYKIIQDHIDTFTSVSKVLKIQSWQKPGYCIPTVVNLATFKCYFFGPNK